MKPFILQVVSSIIDGSWWKHSTERESKWATIPTTTIITTTSPANSCPTSPRLIQHQRLLHSYYHPHKQQLQHQQQQHGQVTRHKHPHHRRRRVVTTTSVCTFVLFCYTFLSVSVPTIIHPYFDFQHLSIPTAAMSGNDEHKLEQPHDETTITTSTLISHPHRQQYAGEGSVLPASSNNNNNIMIHEDGEDESDYKDLLGSDAGSYHYITTPKCAINLFGLPRAFKSLVLPSLYQNVILPNAKYNCDYYIHFYNQHEEKNDGRSLVASDSNSTTTTKTSAATRINPDDIFLLRSKVKVAHKRLFGDQSSSSVATTATTNDDSNNHNSRRRMVRRPIIAFASDTEEEFYQQYDDLLQKITTTKYNETIEMKTPTTKNGGETRIRKRIKTHPLYFPWKDKSYRFPTTLHNIIKMWHSIQSAWNLMERTSSAGTTNHPPFSSSSVEDGDHDNTNDDTENFEFKQQPYERVAMLRSDVIFVTPIDIFDNGIEESTAANRLDPDHSDSTTDSGEHENHLMQPENKNNHNHNKYVVVPAFGKYPVNDRLIYGPYDAVKIWATERFSSMDQHVQYMLKNDPGYGLHSEKFVKHAILDKIEQTKVPVHGSLSSSTDDDSRQHTDDTYQIVEHPTMCFFRARPDESVWISDCSRYAKESVTNNLEKLLQNQQQHLPSQEDSASSYIKLNVSTPTMISRANANRTASNGSAGYQDIRKAIVENALGRTCGPVNVSRKPFRVTLDCQIQLSSSRSKRRRSPSQSAESTSQGNTISEEAKGMTNIQSA